MHVLIILNCKKYAHKRQIQKSTWLKDITIPYYHVIGDESLETEYVIDEPEKIIYVKCKDTYEDLSKKSYMAISACVQTFPTLQYILKTDDDMKCNIDNFNSMRASIRGYEYGGEAIKCVPHMSIYHYPYVSEEFRKPVIMQDTYYCPGRFYFLSRSACTIILSEKDYIFNQMFEDYAIGSCLVKHGVKILPLNANSIFYDT